MATYKVKFRTKDAFKTYEEFITAGSYTEAENVIKRRYGGDLTYVHASVFSEELKNGGARRSDPPLPGTPRATLRQIKSELVASFWNLVTNLMCFAILIVVLVILFWLFG